MRGKQLEACSEGAASGTSDRSWGCWHQGQEQFPGKPVAPPPFGPGEKICVISALPSAVRCQNLNKKWLWLVLSASPVAHEMILLYGSECFSKYLPAGPEVGKDEKCRIGWLHQDVKLTVNNMIY